MYKYFKQCVCVCLKQETNDALAKKKKRKKKKSAKKNIMANNQVTNCKLKRRAD